MQPLVAFLDFLAAHPACYRILNWIVLYEALLLRAGEVPLPFTLLWTLRWYLWFALWEDNP